MFIQDTKFFYEFTYYKILILKFIIDNSKKYDTLHHVFLRKLRLNAPTFGRGALVHSLIHMIPISGIIPRFVSTEWRTEAARCCC